jgi:hypothetical protein
MRTGIGELNWHLNPVKQAKMIKKGLALGLGVSQAEADHARLESNRKFKNSIARFTCKEKNVEPDQDMMDENDDLLDDEDPFVETMTINNNKSMPTVTKKTQSEIVVIDDEETETDNEEHSDEDDEEAETDIEESIIVKTPPRSQRRSYAREASQASNKFNETFIIFDCSDDEDYIGDSDME